MLLLINSSSITKLSFPSILEIQQSIKYIHIIWYILICKKQFTAEQPCFDFSQFSNSHKSDYTPFQAVK